MPIGKNAIKRVSNSGYSNVQSSAPDMENSVVAEKKVDVAPIVEEKAVEVKEAVAKEAPKKTAKKTTKRTVKASSKQGFEYINIGKDLPYYLL